MDFSSELARVHADVAPLGQARVLHRNAALMQHLVAATAFLPSEASATERLHCYVHGIAERPRCQGCGTAFTKWNPRKKVFHATCSPRCAEIVKPMKDRKAAQKRLDDAFSDDLLASLDATDFDRDFAAAFIQKHMLRADGQINGNLARPRSFIAAHGEAAFRKVMTGFYLEPQGRPGGFPRYAYDLVHGAGRCEHCGNVAAFDSFKDGYRAFCSTTCGNGNAEKRAVIRRKLIGSPPVLADAFGAEIRWRRAHTEHACEIARVLAPHSGIHRETDLFFEEAKLAVEVDGVYWHSFGLAERDIELGKRMRHFEKHDACVESGIRLLSVLDVEWTDPVKRPIIESMIQARLGVSRRVYARSCTITRPASAEVRAFLEANHIQGWCQSSTALGLAHEGQLVALMTFGRPRFSKAYQHELLRYCSALGVTVVGGASRLLSAFALDHEGTLVSYANRRFSQGNMYRQLGFELRGTSRPNYFWVKGTSVHHRMNFQKHKLKKQLADFDPDRTEADNMFHAGYRRLWDYGHYVFVKELG